MLSPERLKQRAAIIRAVRCFFFDRDFLEVETPVRLPAVAPEAHIEPERSGARFLRASPELEMKRLLAAGSSRIFQICRCFRQKERGSLHLPEFTMLEWYRSEADYRDLMDDCRDLLRYLGKGWRGPEKPGCDVDAEWEKLTVAEAFRRHGGMSPEEALEQGIFEEILCRDIEPRLGIAQPTILYDYPAELGSLARLKPDDPQTAERFELYVNGVELANGFSELNDPQEQRHRFEQERTKIVVMGRDPGPMPEKFLQDLAIMPPAAGIALGLDRLIMLLCNAATIDEVVAFTPEEL